jgi:hypothetical protein
MRNFAGTSYRETQDENACIAAGDVLRWWRRANGAAE